MFQFGTVLCGTELCHPPRPFDNPRNCFEPTRGAWFDSCIFTKRLGEPFIEEMSSATEQLSTMAQELQRLMGQFKIEANRSAIGGNGHAKNGGNGNAARSAEAGP